MSTEANKRIARSMFELAVRRVATREPIHIAEYAHAALRNPNADTIRALIAQGRGKPWLPSVIDALAEVGIAAAEEILGDEDGRA